MTREFLVVALALVPFILAGCGKPSGPPPKVTRRGDAAFTPPPDPGAWKELEPVLPPYPKQSELIEFLPTGRTQSRFFVDGSSLTVDRDGVVRFAMVARSASGVDNASYSGVHCRTMEWKDYAYAGSSQTWAHAKNSSWQRVQVKDWNNFQQTLTEEFLCSGGAWRGGVQGSAKTIVHNLRYPPTRDPRVQRMETQTR